MAQLVGNIRGPQGIPGPQGEPGPPGGAGASSQVVALQRGPLSQLSVPLTTATVLMSLTASGEAGHWWRLSARWHGSVGSGSGSIIPIVEFLDPPEQWTQTGTGRLFSGGNVAAGQYSTGTGQVIFQSPASFTGKTFQMRWTHSGSNFAVTFGVNQCWMCLENLSAPEGPEGPPGPQGPPGSIGPGAVSFDPPGPGGEAPDLPAGGIWFADPLWAPA
jgi:hypothetical protein